MFTTRCRSTTARVAAVVLMALPASGCGGADDDPSTIDPEPTTSTSESTTTAAAATSGPTSDGISDGIDIDVRVYFARDETLATAGRSVAGPAVARGAVDALLAGPEGIEIEEQMSSAIPDGTELLDLVIGDGVATVDLNGAFESGGGSLSMQMRVAQVVFTLTQFDSVESVDIHLDGRPVEAIGGEGVPADGLDRSDFTNVTPMILVESPVPGETVSSPLEITGLANTFEATVQYRVTDGEGLILDEGFTTATAGNGTFGTFSATSVFDADTPGAGTALAFEDSAEDGSAINVYEVAVMIG